MKSCENCRYRQIDEDSLPCCACIELGADLSGWVGVTNGDRIRGMSDYELAEWIAQILTYHNVKAYVECEKSCPLYRCCNDQPSDNIEDWLKSPAEDGAT